MKKPFQLELFKSQQYQSDGFKKNEYRPNFFGFIRIYEKTISIIIVFLIASLISFSFGVEKGKRLATDLIDQKQPRKNQTQPKKLHAGQTLLANRLEGKKNISTYTIQVATFKTKTYAQKEAERLKKKGLKALIIPRGNFVSVCVGNFSNKHEARISLNRLKKIYQDCFIRRL